MDPQFSGAGAALRPTPSTQNEDSLRNVPKIEPREFEALLQRAMEILNARDLGIELDATLR